jgi:hypothetical protein
MSSDINQKDHLVVLNELSPEAVIATKQNKSTIKYFSIPFVVFYLCYFLTGSYFKTYWLYYNWRAIKRAEKLDISPIGRAIFAVFFVDEFFEHVFNSAKKKGYTGFANHRLLSNFYIVFLGLSLTFGLITIFAGSSILYNRATYSDITPVNIWGQVFTILAIIFGMLKELCFLPVQKAINFYENKIDKEHLLTASFSNTSPIIKYFDVSLTRFLIFDILTLRLYSLYWAYKNWQAIKRAENRNIMPFWRSIFSIFFIHSLFRRICLSAKEQGFPERIPYRQLSTIYVFLFLFLILLGRLVIRLPEYISEYWYDIFILGLGITFDVLCFRPMQRAISFYNNKSISNYKPKKSISRGELIILIIGGLCYILLFAGKLSTLKTASKFSDYSINFSTKPIEEFIKWKTFQPTSKAFEVEFLTQPSYEQESLPINGTKLNAHYEGYESIDSEGTAFSVSCITYPLEMQLNKMSIKEFVDDIVQSSSSNKLIDSKNINVGKHKAVDFLIQNRSGYMQGRIILVGQAKYLLMVNYSGKAYQEKKYQKFIHSFLLKESL